jgi:hypothetical protein
MTHLGIQCSAIKYITYIIMFIPFVFKDHTINDTHISPHFVNLNTNFFIILNLLCTARSINCCSRDMNPVLHNGPLMVRVKFLTNV